jgi:hypothetical protein
VRIIGLSHWTGHHPDSMKKVRGELGSSTAALLCLLLLFILKKSVHIQALWMPLIIDLKAGYKLAR